jgi:hypothetical protein
MQNHKFSGHETINIALLTKLLQDELNGNQS